MNIFTSALPEQRSRRVNRVLAALVIALGASCARPIQPDLSEIYDRVAQERSPGRNPVVLIPGILGSHLVSSEDGHVMWGAFTGRYANPSKPKGARDLAVPMRLGAPLSELRDDVVATGALDRVRLRIFGLPLGLKAYVNILRALGIGGYRDEELGLSGAVDYGDDHFTCFQFAYDWRRDIAENAALLHEFLVEREAYVSPEMERRFGVPPGSLRFDIVAHSSGGLVLRYYLRYGPQPLPEDGGLPELTWEWARRVGRAVLVAPPNAGSGEAFLQLIRGRKDSIFLPRYPAALIGTFPAVYQLMPRPRHGFWRADEGVEAFDPMDAATWEGFGWGLADPRQARVVEWLLPEVEDPQERRRIALDHQAKCLARARQFHAAMDVAVGPPPETELFLVVGDAERTLAGVRIAADGRVITDRYEHGDGTVPRSSALLDERLDGSWTPELRSPIPWAGVMFFFREHLELTRDPAFIDNLLYLLLESPRPPREAGPDGARGRPIGRFRGSDLCRAPPVRDGAAPAVQRAFE